MKITAIQQMGFIGFGFFLILSGCSSTGRNQVVRPMNQTESVKEVESAMGAVVGSVSGQTMEEKDLRDLGRQIENDPEAQTAVESITGSLSDPAALGKYCPVDGERYSSRFTDCPKHSVPLKNIEE